MKINELQHKLLDAYTLPKLNNISLTLINLYKNQQFSVLQKIAELLSDCLEINISNDGKGFSKLIMLYHPDKAPFHINQINKLASENKYDELLTYTHILKLERIDEIANSLNSYEDIDYSPVYDWDMGTEGFSIKNENDTLLKEKKKQVYYDFYDAIKIRNYGHTDIEFPSYYLEDMDEFEMASAGINDLDGVQFCIHAQTMDLSDNKLTDLSPLAGLRYLEELNLSENEIADIDSLSNLINLKKLYLSNNLLEDISPLFELNKLEVVDIRNNNIRKEHIDKLLEMGVTVEF